MKQDRIDATQAMLAGTPKSAAIIDHALDAVREHLGMPIAYLSELVDGKTVFRNVSAPGLEHLIKVGDFRPIDQAYCGHVAEGRLPELIPDTSLEPLAMSLPDTTAAPIGSHVSLPVHRSDGTVFGMFCCLSPTPNPTLNLRDLKVMRMFAGLASEQVSLRIESQAALERMRDRIQAVLNTDSYEIVYQPIFNLGEARLSSFESLSRFRSDPYRPPNKWFDDAKACGLQIDLEVRVIEAALAKLDDLAPGQRLSVNASPDTVASGALLPVFRRFDPNRITLEITEHDQSSECGAFLRAVREINARGTWIAIDDVGAGYAGLQQILRIKPDVLKLDMSLVRDLDQDPARRSLAAALVHFATETNAKVTAEGVERTGELAAIRELGVNYAQGWLLGRPGPLSTAVPTEVQTFLKSR